MKGKEKNADESMGQLKARLIEYQNALKVLKESEKDLRLSEEKFRLMFDNADDLIMHVDRYGMVIDVNRKAKELIGKDRDRIVGKHFTDFGNFEPDAAQEVKRFFREAVESNTTISREIVLKHASGHTVIIDPSISLIKRDGQVEGVLVMMKDITERKRAEEKLTELFKLERDLRHQLEAEMKRRVDFSRTLAHELKTPLTPVLASLDSLLSELKDERLLSLARNIGRGAVNLNTRINELLDLEKGEIGMLEIAPEPVDILQVLRDAVNSVAAAAAGRGQQVSLDMPTSVPWVQADESRLEQVLLNLLGNAIQYTPQDGRITVKAFQKKGAIVVEVNDTGPGMSESEAKRVFDPYRRLVSSKEHSGGLGLGLALCKTLVELHGGQIWVKSRPGVGSTFAFSLPLTDATPKEETPTAIDKLWTVLVIEDDQEILDTISLVFEKDWPEARLLMARFGKEGLHMVETHEPDVVLLDLGLPDMEGLDVLKAIRLFSAVPVVILSVRQEEATVSRALELGANDYITKPFRKMEFLSRLRVQLRGRPATDEEVPIVCGSLRLDPSTFQLTHGAQDISLTMVEGRIMQQLMANAGRVTTHARLAEAVWGGDCDESRSTVKSLRVYIGYLRRKLETDPSKPKLILTKSGVGYWLATPR